MAKKEVKKNKKVIGNTPAHYNEDVIRMVKIGIAIVICFAIVYFAFAIINGELFGSDDNDTEVEIQNVEILMGETFEKKDSDYIIVYYDFNDKINANLYNMLVENYNSIEEIHMYKVDLSTNFSKKYMATEEESSNTKPTALSNLKIKGDTLIRINNKKVTVYLEGKDNIKNYIDGLLK